MNYYSWLAFLANYALESALVVSVALGAAWLLRGSSAEARNLILRGSLTAMFLIPFFMFVVPKVSLPLGKETPVSLDRAFQPQRHMPVVTKSARATMTTAISSAQDSPADNLPLGLIVSVGYLIGCIALAVRWILSWQRVQFIARNSQCIWEMSEPPYQVLFSDSSHIHAPLTFGAVHPKILLPASADEWPDERRRAVMLHETAHIQRADWVWQTLSDLMCLIQWFNPAVWIVSSQLRGTAEEAADDATLRAGIAPSSYARELLSFVTLEGLHGVGMARKANVDNRVRRVLGSSVDRSRPGLRLALGLFASMSLLGVAMAGIRVVGQDIAGAMSNVVRLRLGHRVQTIANSKDAGGISARVLYVYRKDGPRAERWRADGSPATEADLAPKSIEFEASQQEDAGKAVWVNFEVSGVLQKMDSRFKGDFDSMQSWITWPMPGNKVLLSRKLIPNSPNQIAGGSMGVASAPWKLISSGKLGVGELHAVATNRIAAEHAVYDPETGLPKRVKTYDLTTSAVEVVIPEQYEGYDFQVRVYDSNGRSFVSNGGSLESFIDSRTGIGRRSYDFPISRPDSIARVELYTRPWVWLSFKGIRLSPNASRG